MFCRRNSLAWSILAAVFIGMSVYLILNPTRTGVTINYRLGSSNWWTDQLMYDPSTHGFLYFPTFAVLFTPWNLVRPEILGEILWRAMGFGLLAVGLWKLIKWPQRPGALQKDPSLCRDAGPASESFLMIVLLAVPASLASLSNGQTNLPLSGSLVLAALALRDLRWGSAAFLLSLGLVFKPIALAPFLLAWAVFPAVRRPLMAGVLAVALIGLLHPHFEYALGQWGEFYEKLVRSYTPQTLRVSDLFGAIDRVGVQMPPILEKGVRAAVSAGALVWVWQSFRRRGVAGASWALWVATALVFTIFNPRAETNSYVLISPLLAFAAISYWRQVEGDRWKGWVLAAACIGLMCDGMGLWIYKATDVWLKPTIVLLVSPLLFRMPDSWKIKSRESN